MPIIDEEFLSKLIYEPIFTETPEEERDAFTKIQQLCSVRERCSSELRDRLAKAEFSSHAIDEAVQRAIRCGLVDDVRFADILVRSRVSQGKGKPGIAAELKQKGIDPHRLEGWPEVYFQQDGDTEYLRALELLRRKPVRSKNVLAGAYRKLASRGYSPSVCSAAAHAYAKEVGSRVPDNVDFD